MSQKGAQVIAPRTYTTGGAVVRFRAVKRGADATHVVQGTAASTNLGIAMDGADAAEKEIPVADRPGEKPLAEVGAAVALDALLASDANGRLVTATSGQVVTAIAREIGAASGDIIQVEIAPAGMKAP